MKKLFTQVRQILSSVFDPLPAGNELKRINSLSGFMCGMIRKGSSHLPDIGSGLRQNINAHSKTIAAKRFVENKWIGYQTHYLPFLSVFFRMILFLTPVRERLLLVIDGSQMGKDHAALMISIVWQNRGFPVCWLVKKGSKGHFTEENHVKVLQKAAKALLPLIPQNREVVLLGDGEFDGIDLQKFCLSCSWDYVLRTACDTVLYDNDERFQARDIEPLENQNCAFIPDVEFSGKRFRDVNFLCWHDRKRHQDPIFLVSSLADAGDIMEFYDRRYSIECLFKDLKSTSFNLHKTRLKKAYDIDNLILIAALAFILTLLIAIRYDTPEWRKKVQRVRPDRKVLSVFSFAYKLIHYFLENELDFLFSFHFSKNEEPLSQFEHN